MKEGIKKLNCWQFKKCGCEIGGKLAERWGVCPVVSDNEYNGKNGGKKAGRYCWKIKGTLCKNKKEKNLFNKFISCIHCDFFNLVQNEEGRNFQI